MENINNIHGIKYEKKIKNIKETFDNLNNNSDNSEYNILYDKKTTIDPINNLNKVEINELETLKTEYERSIARYQNELKILNNMINNYTISYNTQYKNKNIKLPSGEIGYVTNNGVWKLYPSSQNYSNIAGKKGCPAINDLKDTNGKFDTTYNIVDVDEKNKFLIGSSMKEGQGCGISGTNIYVTNTETPIDKQQYSGCYNLNESNGLIYQEDMGNKATINSCRIRAFDTNSEVFALSSSNGLSNNGKCYVGKNLSNVMNGGQAVYTRIIWRQTLDPINNARSCRLNYAGQLEILDSDNNVLWVSNPPQDNCDPNNGGKIKIKNATWGGNCDGKLISNRNPSLGRWNVQTNNLLSYVNSIANGNDRAEFTLNNNIIIPETNDVIGDPAVGCKKTFRSYYRCGTQGGSLLKSSNINAEANGSLVIYDCQEHTQRCENFKLYVNDNLNVFIKDGKTNNNIWETKTNNISKYSIPTNNYNSLSSKYEREYINPGEILKHGEFIGSPNGNCYLIFINDVGLELRINVLGCKKSDDGNFYGGNITDDMNGIYFTVYNGYFNDDLSYFNKANVINTGITNNLTSIETSTNNNYSSTNTIFSIVFTGVLFIREEQNGDWNFKLTSDDSSYMWIGEENVKNSTLSNAFISNGGIHDTILKQNTINLNGGTYYPIKVIFGNNSGKGNFSLKFSGPGVSERSNLDGYIYVYTPNDGLATYSIQLNGDNTNNLGKVGYVTPDGNLKQIPTRLLKLSNNEYRSNYIEIGNYNNTNNDISVINSNNVDLCKQKCNENNNCYGFVYKDDKCYLKGSDIYPKTARIYDESSRLFKRNIDILSHSSCNKNVVSIDNNRWNDFPIDLSGNEIDENTTCEMTSYLNDQKNKVLQETEKLNEISTKLIDRINKLNISDDIIKKKLGLTSKNILDTLNDLKTNKSKYDSKVKELNINEKGMKFSSYSELLSDNYNYLIWSILAVSITVGSIYYIKKKNININ